MIRSLRILFLSFLSLFVNASWGQFGAEQLVHPFGGNNDMRAADIDGDGDKDLFGVFGGHHLKWFANLDGAGTFSNAISVQSLLGDCDRYLLRDVDGDGDVDIILVETNEDGIEILTNDGNGQFATWLQLTGSSHPKGLACDDVNGDGFVDIISSLGYPTGAGFSIHFGNASGFDEAIDFDGIHQASPNSTLLIGDVDLLGGVDLVMRGVNDELILLRNGSGDGLNWSNEPLPLAAGQPAYAYRAPQLIDVDGDGDLDLAESRGPSVHWLKNGLDEGGVLDFGENVIETWTSSGNGVFGTSPCGIGSAVVFVPGNPSLPVRWNSYLPELEGFPYSNDLPALPRGLNVLLADLNGDGKDDLVMTLNDRVVWYPNTLVPFSGVLELPVLDTLCVIGDPVPLPDAVPAGGRWYGSQISNDLLFRSNLGATMDLPMVHAVYAEEGCPMASSTSIRLIQAPVVTTTVPGVLCSADAPIQLASDPMDVAWYGLNGSSIIDPAIWNGGYIVCTYTDATMTTCTDVEGPILRWNTLPASIAPAGPFCTGDQVQTISAAAAPPSNVTWSGPVSGSTPASSLFDPSQGAGAYEIIMTVEPYGPNQCGNSDTLLVVVHQTPLIAFTPTSTYCVSGTPIPLNMATPEDGFWSGSGVSDGSIDPEVAGPGIHLISYFVTTDEGCSSQSATTIELSDVATVTGPTGVLCPGDAPVPFFGTPMGGTWNTPVSAGGLLDPALLSPGPITVLYAYTDPRGCVLSATEHMIEMGAPKAVQILDVGALCTTTPPFELEGTGSGIWSGAVNGEGTSILIDPSELGPGVWPITLTVTPLGECAGSATTELVVDICAGVQESGSMEIGLAPNPFTEITFLTFNGQGPVTINVLDASGRSVSRSTNSAASRLAIDLGGHLAGLYTVQVIHDGGVRSLRAIKVD